MAADPERILRWRNGRLMPEAIPPARLLVADSFLLADGGVVGIERHRDRFLSSVRSPEVAEFAGTPAPRDAEQFWDAAVPALPAEGSWFPRLELAETAEGPAFLLRVRAAPPLSDTVTVATWAGPDPRRVPSIKGPDLKALLQARAATAARGAGEAVLLSPDGFVCDGTTSGVAWWEDETLCFPPPELERVESVTAACLADLVAGAGLPVAVRMRQPEDLVGREVWVLNALHGLRRVDAWLDGPAVASKEGRLEEWRERLERLRGPLHSRSDASFPTAD
jgi:branched-subunit amino acid aminotransferase/4-amino-4-deoxychorismate lyase